jgi:hypothetical protein
VCSLQRGTIFRQLVLNTVTVTPSPQSRATFTFDVCFANVAENRGDVWAMLLLHVGNSSRQRYRVLTRTDAIYGMHDSCLRQLSE